MIRKEAWPFYRTSSGVRLCWELEEPKGPNGYLLVVVVALVEVRKPHGAILCSGGDGQCQYTHLSDFTQHTFCKYIFYPQNTHLSRKYTFYPDYSRPNGKSLGLGKSESRTGPSSARGEAGQCQ